MKLARKHASNNLQTYFVSSNTWERRSLFRTESWARLFFNTLLTYRGQFYSLHHFVLMPDHFHILITPTGPLEQAIQLIKGGFSFRAGKEFESGAEIWQRGFADHRIRDNDDYEKHASYIHLNPVKRGLCCEAPLYPYSSAFLGWKLDPIPRWLKPRTRTGPISGTAEAVPFQSTDNRLITADLSPRKNTQA